jgi:hypothetical protein
VGLEVELSMFEHSRSALPASYSILKPVGQISQTPFCTIMWWYSLERLYPRYACLVKREIRNRVSVGLAIVLRRNCDPACRQVLFRIFGLVAKEDKRRYKFLRDMIMD